MANSVQIEIAKQVSEIGPAVQGRVVDIVVERELEKRALAFVQVLDKLSKTEKELKKITPDQISFNEKREKVAETYSKTKLDERDKVNQRIEKLTKAMNKALEHGDFSDVYQLSTSDDQKKDRGGNSEETPAETA